MRPLLYQNPSRCRSSGDRDVLTFVRVGGGPTVVEMASAIRGSGAEFRHFRKRPGPRQRLPCVAGVGGGASPVSGAIEPSRHGIRTMGLDLSHWAARVQAYCESQRW